jgi:hypothetical protein
MVVVDRICDGLEGAEFDIPGMIVADVAVTAGPHQMSDGSAMLTIEALTVADD